MRQKTPTTSFEERLAKETQRLKEAAKLLPPGPIRDVVLQKVRQTETASHISDWLSSPSLSSQSAPEINISRDLSPLRRQAADTLRRARKLPAGPYRNDLRQLAGNLRHLEQSNFKGPLADTVED